MGLLPKLLKELSETMQCTYSILDEVALLGFGYVAPLRLVIDKTDKPTWRDDATITIDPECSDPRCIAHEMGHGWHLWQRLQNGYEDKFGEEAAEAIRLFTEQRMGNQKWKPISNYRKIIDVCGESFDCFKSKLEDGTLFTEMNWKKRL